MMNIISDNTLNQCPVPVENGNNEIQSTTTTSGLEVEADPLTEATILAQRRSAKYVT